MRSSKVSASVRLIGLIVAGGLLAAFWWRVNPVTLAAALAHLRVGPLVMGVALFVPQIALSALRWHLISGCGLRSAARAVLVANALNLVVPGKLGDFAKAVTSTGGLRFGAGLVAGERAGDVLAIVVLGGLLCALDYPVSAYRWTAGLVGATGFVTLSVAFLFVRLGRFSQGARGLGALAARIFRPAPVLTTAALWALHGAQVVLFSIAAGATSSVVLLFALAQWTFLGSAVPLAPWGLGSRESLMLLLFSPVEEPAVIGATAALFLLRYWVPGLAGLPALAAYGLHGIRLGPVHKKREHPGGPDGTRPEPAPVRSAA